LPGLLLYWQDREMVNTKNQQKKQKNYVLLTGKDDAEFCQRVSDRMDEGYELYGSPAMTFNILKGHAVVAQALILKKAKAKPKTNK
jgi:hypothetical protein